VTLGRDKGEAMVRIWLALAAICGFAGVALGAFGAHALKNVLSDYGRTIYEKALFYHMVHALALLAVGLLQHRFQQINFTPAGCGFAAGILLFSGSLYALALGGLRWLGAITPFGGVAFLFGWLWLWLATLRLKP